MIQMGIAVDELADYVAEREIEDFVEEFQLLPTGFTKPYEESQKEENKSKNKYAGIYPYDDSRVVLEGRTSDYINASFIDDQLPNIWMIFYVFGEWCGSKKCGIIIMLANIREGQDNKSEQYWPEQEYSGLYGDINITCHNEKKCAIYTVRTLELQTDTEKRRVNHFHFTAWPEKGVPEDVMGLVEFRQVINNARTELDGPTLVHCSAGVGLTGIFIALDILSKEGEASGRVDIFTCVRNLRYQRAKMVQTAEQYEFLHHALVRSLTPYSQLDFNSQEQLEVNLYEECRNVTRSYITPVY